MQGRTVVWGWPSSAQSFSVARPVGSHGRDFVGSNTAYLVWIAASYSTPGTGQESRNLLFTYRTACPKSPHGTFVESKRPERKADNSPLIRAVNTNILKPQSCKFANAVPCLLTSKFPFIRNSVDGGRESLFSRRKHDAVLLTRQSYNGDCYASQF
jgi:hypothetical protein